MVGLDCAGKYRLKWICFRYSVVIQCLRIEIINKDFYRRDAGTMMGAKYSS